MSTFCLIIQHCHLQSVAAVSASGDDATLAAAEKAIDAPAAKQIDTSGRDAAERAVATNAIEAASPQAAVEVPKAEQAPKTPQAAAPKAQQPKVDKVKSMCCFCF